MRTQSDLAYESGFQAISEMCRRRIETLKERVVRDAHLPPEDVAALLHEVRILQGIVDIPRIIRQKCHRNS